MEIKIFTPHFSASPQISAEDVVDLDRFNFVTIINNRPDNEEPGQPDSKEIESAARVAGINYYHIPVVPGGIGDDQIAAFEAAISESPGPILAFCRTGTRSATLWALTEASRSPADAVLTIAAKAGYELTKYRGQIEARVDATQSLDEGSSLSGNS